jgi:NADH:ubiquinone oxidoreductase subunit 6 (subunit J)
MFFYKLLLVDIVTALIYIGLVSMIWEVLTRRFLIEKIFSLILVFVFLAFALLLAGLEFLSLVTLLVYVGAISVLFLFVVMMVSPDYRSLVQDQKATLSNWEQLFDAAVEAAQYAEQLEKMEEAAEAERNKSKLYVFKQHVLGVLWGVFCVLVFNFKIMFPFLKGSNTKTNNALEAAHTQELETQDTPFVYIDYSYHPSTIFYKKNMQLTEVGTLLYTKYGISVFVIGAALLVAMLSSILLSLYQTLDLKRQTISKQAKRYKFKV